MTVYAHDISPDVLEDGFWVLGRDRILHWVEVAQKPAPIRLHEHPIVCPVCDAEAVDWCRTSSGKARHPHKERLSPRVCACGAELHGKARYCDPCRDEVRAETFRAYQRRRGGNKRLWDAVAAMYGEAS